jgi:hypothetical protein
VLPFVIEHVAQTWLSVPFALDLMVPEESEDFAGFDTSELRKDGPRIVKALVDSEDNLQIPCLEDDYYTDSQTVVSLYHAMVGEETDSANVREKLLRIFVHDYWLRRLRNSSMIFSYQLRVCWLTTHQTPNRVPNLIEPSAS